MPSTTLISVEEYLSTSYDPDCDYIDGEVIERNMGEADHGNLQNSIGAWLWTRRKALRIHVFTETRTQVARTRFRIPDIAVTTHKTKGRILREPPFLCIEILSPEDRVSRMEVKIDDYLKFGVAHVWLIDPRKKLAWSYTRGGRREATAVLTTSEPRIELPIAELFAELDLDVDVSAE
ncbi:MAG TPA: Uma2 family endonuclease [Bryobacteraceae bacterium]|nr:Uma2 family endonuclease [Bryobacteraceae bacterium]